MAIFYLLQNLWLEKFLPIFKNTQMVTFYLRKMLGGSFRSIKSYWPTLKNQQNGKKLSNIPLLMVNDELITEFEIKVNIYSHLSTANSLQSTTLKTLFYFAWLEIIWLLSFSISPVVIFQLIKNFDLKALKNFLVSGNKLLTSIFLVKLLEKLTFK